MERIFNAMEQNPDQESIMKVQRMITTQSLQNYSTAEYASFSLIIGETAYQPVIPCRWLLKSGTMFLILYYEYDYNIVFNKDFVVI